MFGIYVHIPFCKQFCYYCDFYKSANYRFLPDFLKAVQKEISEFHSKMRFFDTEEQIFSKSKLRTIYFGGGSPSSIQIKDIEHILLLIQQNFKFSIQDIELSIEVNPDDTNISFYHQLKQLGFNRLTIGVQSFNDKILTYLHRKHSATEAIQSVKDAQAAGFENIGIDLIYGIPGQSLSNFEYDLSVFFDLNLVHLSAYHLSIEDYTEFGRRLKKNTLKEVSETLSNKFYSLLCRQMKQNNYEHYEISNFALKGYRSKHNSSYWNNYPYISFGPSAHSYNGRNLRYANFKPVSHYIRSVLHNLRHFELEKLSLINRYNEFIINGLRTIDGINISSFFDDLMPLQDSRLRSDTVLLKTHYQSVVEILKQNYKDAFSAFSPNLVLKESYYLTADYYLDKLIYPDE